ncbi:MAG: carbohydrate ABC transporter permease [Anaerolineae bacterium]
MATAAVDARNDAARRQRTLRQVSTHTILIIGALVAMFPFVWMVLTSLKTFQEYATQQFLPAVPQWSNYATALTMAPFGRYLANTLFISVSTTALVLFTSALAAYAFARMNFFGREVIFIIFLTTLMIPFEITMIPNFLTIRDLGWIDSYAALIFPFGASVFAIFLLRQFFAQIPSDYYDAAVLDGASHLRFLVAIVLPLSQPALVSVALFTFLGSWNSLLWPLIVTNSPEMRPIQVGLYSFINEASTNTHLLMAASVIAVAPILVLYFFAQKQFIEGISGSGLKG